VAGRTKSEQKNVALRGVAKSGADLLNLLKEKRVCSKKKKVLRHQENKVHRSGKNWYFLKGVDIIMPSIRCAAFLCWLVWSSHRRQFSSDAFEVERQLAKENELENLSIIRFHF
jgi:hypothetical protein